MRAILSGVSLLAVLLGETQNRGFSYIGLCHKEVRGREVLRAFRGLETINVHFLHRTFNAEGCQGFQELAKDQRPMVLHVSLINGAGLRNRRLQRHEFFWGYTVQSAEKAIRQRKIGVLRQVRRAAVEVKRLIEAREGRPTVVRIKPILESDFSRPTRRIVFREVEGVFPGVELIDNPVRGKCLEGVLCETHGLDTRGDIVDLDGISADEIDLKKWTAETSQKVGSFYWVRCNNGMRAEEIWIEPLKRKNWCQAEELEKARGWMAGEDEKALQVARLGQV